MTSLGLEQIPERSASKSVLDEIRADYERAEQDEALRQLNLAVPGSKLGVRYKAVDPDDFPEIDEDATSTRNIDILVFACDCIVVRDENGDWEPVEIGGEPVKFEAAFATYMGWTCPTARDVVLKVFSGIPSPMYGVNRHVIAVSGWMSGQTTAREEALLGES